MFSPVCHAKSQHFDFWAKQVKSKNFVGFLAEYTGMVNFTTPLANMGSKEKKKYTGVSKFATPKIFGCGMYDLNMHLPVNQKENI